MPDPIVKLAALDQLAALYGIPGQYIDAAGQPVNIDSELKKTALEAMGVPVASEPHIQASIAAYEEKQWTPLLPKVQVLHQGKPFTIPVQVPETRLNNAFKGQLIPEKGEPQSLEVRAGSLRELDRKALKNTCFVRLELELPGNLPAGYHEIILDDQDRVNRCLLIVAPSACYEPPSLISATQNSNSQENIWGSSIQLYTLRSEHNWGMGDFTDLKELVTRLAKEGADILGLNPIHALYPSNPNHCSPYSPSSRAFINPLYIDVCSVNGYETCPEVTEQVNKPDFQNRLQQSRNTEYVDYSLVASLKYPVLEALFQHFQITHVSGKTEQAAAFDQYCRRKGQALERHGTYEALFEHFKSLDINSWGWPCWPSEYQHPSGSGATSFARQKKDRIRFYRFLQWQAEMQLEEAQQAALAAGMKVGIYRDLAVGVDRGGADVWSEPENYILSASVGAPPDTVAPQGQNWGLPPFNPEQLANKAYGPFIEMVQSNMQHCSALRIDHVMGLLRLWWCPPEKTADYGVYVNYPLDDLLGIIKLESQRNQCLVFGEDLGTVPPEIETALPPARCY
ncbi:MAG: 4-alpha-glucanotransferase, partial [Endozoicomonas sp.]